MEMRVGHIGSVFDNRTVLSLWQLDLVGPDLTLPSWKGMHGGHGAFDL